MVINNKYKKLTATNYHTIIIHELSFISRNNTMNSRIVKHDLVTYLITTKDNLRKSIDNNDILNQFCNNKDLLREDVMILKDYDEWFFRPMVYTNHG